MLGSGISARLDSKQKQFENIFQKGIYAKGGGVGLDVDVRVYRVVLKGSKA